MQFRVLEYPADKMNKKAVSLSLETVVIAVIVLVVLALILFFILKYGGYLGSNIGEQAKQSSSLLTDITAP